MKTLVIGYGNDSRNDDGAGWFVVNELSRLGLPGVTLEVAHQLEVDFAETVRDYEKVIFVDAAVPESPQPWWSAEVEPGFQSHAVAHYMTPGDVLGLCQTLYGRAPRGELFSIRGHDFNFGTTLSPATRQAATEVAQRIAAGAQPNSGLPAPFPANWPTMTTNMEPRFQIAEARWLAPDIKRFRIHAPRIAKKQKPGQFVIIRIDEHGERIPLTIAESDPQSGTVTVIVQGIGKTTKQLNTIEAGANVADVVGPLGKPSEIEKFGTCVVIGGGVGTAIAYPTAKALKAAGNHVITIIGGRNRQLVILEEEARAFADEVFITTDDGSHGEKGLVIDPLKRLIAEGRKIDYVLAIGPIPMMRAVANVTRDPKIKTVVSLNPVMVDGTGMCGGCRVLVDGKSQFACVDGPEFDAHHVDFDVLTKRNAMYRDAERKALEKFQAEHKCKLEGMVK
jgi:ferredoxin--NADP+ reductase